MLFRLVSFIFHPVQFVKDYWRSYKKFDKNGYPRDGSI